MSAEYTYVSTQATNCASCGLHKHTPLRVDWMGGYVCLTCIDRVMESIPAAPPLDDDNAPIIYDTSEVDELTHALTGDEGEDDSVTVLRRFANYVKNVWPDKTALQVLKELDERTCGVPAAPAALPTDRLEQVIDGYVADYECNDGEAFHAPNEHERFLIKDAIMGLLGYPEWDEEWGKLIEQRARERAAHGVDLPDGAQR